MLAAGASNGDSDVAPMVPYQSLQPALKKSFNIPEHVFDLRLRLEELCNRCVPAGLLAQASFVMRIGKHAHIKNVVSVERHPTFEGERLKHQRELGGWRGDQ